MDSNVEGLPVSEVFEKLYEIVPSEDLFGRAKEYSWQTFLHHSLSVGLIGYRIGTLLKSAARGLAKVGIESIERSLNLDYEYVLLLAGLAHDYVKLYKGHEKKGENEIKEILRKFLSIGPIFVPRENVEKIISKIIAIARSIEAVSDPDLNELEVLYIAQIVRLADTLMGMASVDEGLAYIQTSREAGFIRDKFGLDFGFIKISVPGILLAKISKSIVNKLFENGWAPLVIYSDGIIFLGSRTSKAVPITELAELVKKEVSETLGLSRAISELVKGLEKKGIARIFDNLKQSECRELPIQSVPKKDALLIIYHNAIAKYLGGAKIPDLVKYVEEVKEKIGKKHIIDPRILATGLGKGSTYFSDFLSSVVASREQLIDKILKLDDRARFLVVAYAAAFPSKLDEKKIITGILKDALDLELPSDLDVEVLRIVAIALAYKHRSDTDVVKKILEAIYARVGGPEDLDHYVRRFIRYSIKGNVIAADSLEAQEAFKQANNYCRICSAPLLRESIRFIEYAKSVGRGGGGSEIWLHDDPPLVSLEKIATNRDTSIRFICPLCLYEAKSLRDYLPPFFVIAMHPVVSYDLWEYLVKRLSYIADLWALIQRRSSKVAKIYESVLEKDLKITSETLNKEIAERGKPSEEKVVMLFDNLGARIYVPLGRDLSLSKKHVAVALALAPIAMSASGGGQVGLLNSLAYTHSLGSGLSPLVMPHTSNFIPNIVRIFEDVRRSTRGSRQMTPDEYASYNLSYVALLKSLFIYGLKLFGWFDGWRRRHGKEIYDYAIAMHEYMDSIPYAPLSLSSPPPASLDPRDDDRKLLPHYKTILLKSLEVEKYMGRVLKTGDKAGGGESKHLNSLLYRYAYNLRELRGNLSKYKVQRPLREAINLLLRYSKILGEEDAKGIAIDEFLKLLELSLNLDLEEKKKKVKRDGSEEEISYRAIFFSIFNEIADLIFRFRKELNPGELSKFIEVMLDSVYEKYRHIDIRHIEVSK